jgi:hypothetical protein
MVMKFGISSSLLLLLVILAFGLFTFGCCAATSPSHYEVQDNNSLKYTSNQQIQPESNNSLKYTSNQQIQPENPKCPTCQEDTPCKTYQCSASTDYKCKETVVFPCCGDAQCTINMSENFRTCKQDCSLPSINDTVSFEGVEYTVKNIQITTSLGSIFTKDADGLFVIANIDIKNNNKKSVSLMSNNFQLVDDQKREFDMQGGQSMFIADGFSIMEDLQPSVKLNRNLVFEIAGDVKVLFLQLDSTNILSNEKLYFLVYPNPYDPNTFVSK